MSVLRNTVKSMPTPGIRSTPLSMSASWSWPCALTESIACAFVIPSGRNPPTTPEKMMSVARPRILGPSEVSATLTTAATTTAMTLARSGRSRFPSRLIEGPKASGFWPTIPPPNGPPWPGPPWPLTRSVSFMVVCCDVTMFPPPSVSRQSLRTGHKSPEAHHACRGRRCRRPRAPRSGRHR